MAIKLKSFLIVFLFSFCFFVSLLICFQYASEENIIYHSASNHHIVVKEYLNLFLKFLK